MKTIYIHNGVAYLSKDLAILNGADKLSLSTLKLNETYTEDLDYSVDLRTVTIEDGHENQLVLNTNLDLEYFDLEETFIGLSKDFEDTLQQHFIDFASEFDAKDYFDEY